MEDYRLDQSGQEVQDILNGAAMQVDLTAETERATEAEQTLQGNIDAEATRATDAEGTLQDNIDAEEARAKAAEKQNADDIDAIEEKIPSGASSSNKLATEEYVADAVATATAIFRGTYNLVSDLHLNVTATEQQIAAALAGAISTADNNDYCFIQVPTSSETPTEIKEIDRYKFNGTAWAFEYKLNNSGFTAAQWAAINSGITSGDVAKLAALPTNAQLTTLLAGLQSDIDGEETRAKAAELALQGNIDAEEARAKAAEKQNADDIDAIEAVIPESASSENKVATKSEIDSLSAAIEAILLLIPSAATSLNKLADKAYVNSSIATATATFRGTYNLVNDLGITTSATHAQIATALAGAILTADNNDYAFVQIPTSDAMPTEIAKTERYKFNGTAWEYEYDLNNSGFTADQWAAINSGITQALVTKLSDLPTNAQLTTELGTLTSGITTINQKIPNAASQANKLVDTAAMESYIVQVLDVLTASFNVTSTDGHVTVQISQVDGKITSVSVSTSDIASAAALNLKASQADLTALASRVTTAEGNITSLGGRMTTAEGNITTLGGRMTTAEGNITSLGGRVSTNETDIEDLKAAYAGLTQSDIIIGALPASGVANKIYRVPGTNSYSDYMWNGTQFVLMATYNNAIDPRPKKASQNLVTSGGVFDNMGALDVSELNATENPHTLAQYVDLSAALAAIPTDYQKGGMSIKFVQSSDNKYVQYRCMAQNFTTDVTQWQGVDDEPTAGSDNLVKSGGVFNSVSYLKEPIIKTSNLFNYWSANNAYKKTLNQWGQLDDYDYENVTGYIPVKPQTNYISNAIIRHFGWFDSSLNLIGYEQSETAANTVVTSPQGAAFVRLDISVYYWKQTIVFNEGDTVLPFEKPYELNKGVNVTLENNAVTTGNIVNYAVTEEKIDKGITTKLSLIEKTTNLFNYWSNNNAYHKTINIYGGLDDYQNENVSDYISINPQTNYICNVDLRHICWFDEQLNVVGYEQNTISANTAITSPANATSVRLDITVDCWKENIMFNTGNNVLPFKKPYNLNKGVETNGFETLNIANSDKIAIIGDSWTDGGFNISGKAYINKLSEFSDYVFVNFGTSGSTNRGQLEKIRNNTPIFGTIPFSSLRPKFAMMQNWNNDIKTMTSAEFFKELDNICRVVQSLGCEPIIVTPYYTHYDAELGLTARSGLRDYAKRHNHMYWDIASYVDYLYPSYSSWFSNWWSNSHPGTRVNNMESDNYEKYLQLIERPLKSVKVFRKRSGVTVSSLDDLMFTDNEHRARIFREINVGNTAIQSQYVDDVNNASISGTSIADEYQKLIAKQSVSFSDYGLISVVLPYYGQDIRKLKFTIQTTGTIAGVYVKNGLAQPFSNTYDDSCGHWVPVSTDEDGNYVVPDSIISSVVDIDKLNILIAGSFSIKDIQIYYIGNGQKSFIREINTFETNEENGNNELLPSNRFGTAGTLDENWNVTPTLGYENSVDFLPKNCISKVTVNDSNSLNCTLTVQKNGNAILEVWCRYFPAIYTDGSGNQITEQSYDYNELFVDFGNGEQKLTLKERVGTAWKIIRFPIQLYSGVNNIPIKFYSNENGIEIAYVSLKYK